MQEEDWFMRQINMLGRVLGKILVDLLGLKARGKVREGIEAAEKTLISELDLNIDDLLLIPEDQFINILKRDKSFNDDNLDNLAEIFFLMAEELERKDAEAAKREKLYARSLVIYEYLEKSGSTYSVDRHYKIQTIKNSI